MPDPDEIARALSRLATGDSPTVEPHWPDSERPCPNPERVVAEAEASMAQVDRAATFLAGGGEPRLEDAIQCADAGGDDELAARGRAVLATLEEYRLATRDESAECPTGHARTTSTALAQRSSGGES